MSHHWGYVAVLFSAVLFGVSTTVNKVLLESFSPLMIASVTYIVAGLFLGAATLLPQKAGVVARLKIPTSTGMTEPTWRDVILLLLTALFGGVLAPALYLLGLNSTTAVSTALLGNTEALFTMLIAFVFLGERGRAKDYGAMVLLIIGAVILTTNLNLQQFSTAGTFLGNALVVLSCLCWGIDNSLARLLTVRGSVLKVGSLKGIIGGGLLFATISLYGMRISSSLQSIVLLVMVGIFSIGLSLLLFLFSLQQIGAMRTSVIFATASLFGAVSAFFVLHESISLLQALAGILMLGAIYVLAIPKKESAKSEQASRWNS